jgi:hypothetical protein
MNAPAPILRGSRQHDLFALTAESLVYDAVEMTLMSLAEHGPKHEHWAMAWSGGKDSAATLTLIVHLIEAHRLGRPRVDLLNAEVEARIRELIAAGTWPQKWTGDEPVADVPLDAVFVDGSVQPLLIGAEA